MKIFKKMKKLSLLLIATILLMAGTSFAQGGWNYVSNSGTSFILYGMSFPPGQSNIGYACGREFIYNSDGVIIKTTDGGDNWTQIWPVSGSIDGLRTIWFVNDNVGFAGGWNSSFIKTTDGGTSWTPVTVGTNINHYIDVVFYNENKGVVAVYPGNPTTEAAVYVTNDGGNNWTAGNNIATPDIEGICYATEDSLFAVGTTSKVYISTDGGYNWSVQTTLNDLLYGVDFANSDFGVAAGQEYMYTTNDGGATWTPNFVWYESYYGTKAFDDGTGYVSGTYEDIYVTSNYGGNWVLDNDGSGTSTLYRTRFTHDGTGFSCGSQGTILKKEPALLVDFIADMDTVCEGGSVNFTDISSGSPNSWNWTFESGTPATSTQQNPVINYSTVGIYDVTLVISDGTFSDSITKEDYINVVLTPGQANTPIGADSLCAGSIIDYTTNVVQYASYYDWEVSPSDAGSMSGNDTVATFQSSSTFTGSYLIKVRAVNVCGNGIWSGEFQGTLLASPQIFQLTGNGAYCEGSQGAELGLDGSETGVNYELYKDNIPTGNIVAGTDSAISFGYIIDEGLYSSVGFNGGCTNDMLGQVWVNMINAPGQAGTPVGPEAVCNDTTTVYNTTGASDADTLIWILDPINAGVITGSGTTITIEWDIAFSSIAALTVYGQNDCGDGPVSDTLSIEVFAAPNPEISGLQLVCNNETADYQTTENTGSIYQWDVTGGSIIAGSGTHQVTVEWGAPGLGTLVVTEINIDNCQNTSDEFLVTIDDCTGIGENNMKDIRVYPNPANDMINISIPGQGKINIRIVNMVGQVLIDLGTRIIKSSEMSVNITKLDKGIYFIHIIDADGTGYIGKFVKAE